MTDEFDFAPADDADIVGAPIKSGEQVQVVAQFDDDGEPSVREGTTKNREAYKSIRFVVKGGPHDGRWVTLFLTINPNNFFFRRDVTALTGVDVNQGAKVTWATVLEAITSHIFTVSVSVKDGQTPDRPYINVSEIHGREPYAHPAEDQPLVSVSNDDDIPF